MASGARLALTFRDSGGDKITFGYNYADPEVETAAVQALMNGMITNGSIFEDVPTAIDSAKVVVTTETVLNVTE